QPFFTDPCRRGGTPLRRRSYRPITAQKKGGLFARRFYAESGGSDGSRHLTLRRILLGTTGARECRVTLTVGDDGLAEPSADLPQLLELGLAQLGISLRHELHGIVEPLILLFRRSLQHTTSMDVAHQLVTRVVQIGSL